MHSKSISVETWREKNNYAKNRTKSYLKKLPGGGKPEQKSRMLENNMRTTMRNIEDGIRTLP